jgi:hypothetical protein
MHSEADQDALDLIRSLMSMHVTLVLTGVVIPGSGLLAEAVPARTARRRATRWPDGSTHRRESL